MKLSSTEDQSIEPSIIHPIDTQLRLPLSVSSTSISNINLTHCRNPMGRTGVRGRGALIRWGPNKSIMAIITRWKRHHNQFVIVDGQRILEAMVLKDKITNDWKLPAVSIIKQILSV